MLSGSGLPESAGAPPCCYNVAVLAIAVTAAAAVYREPKVSLPAAH